MISVTLWGRCLVDHFFIHFFFYLIVATYHRYLLSNSKGASIFLDNGKITKLPTWKNRTKNAVCKFASCKINLKKRITKSFLFFFSTWPGSTQLCFRCRQVDMDSGKLHQVKVYGRKEYFLSQKHSLAVYSSSLGCSNALKSAVHWINHYPTDDHNGKQLGYPVDKDELLI